MYERSRTMGLASALHYSHTLLAQIVSEGDTVIDATVGNGYDTLFLADLVGDSGKVIGFDIQSQAILVTSKKLKEKNLLNRTALYQQGHETIETVLPEKLTIKAAIFNLGYLPNSDKKLITKGKTTIKALSKILLHLEKGGRVILVVYYGHPGGLEEKESVETFVQALPQETYNVLSYQFINQKNAPPLLLCIEKKVRKNAP